MNSTWLKCIIGYIVGSYAVTYAMIRYIEWSHAPIQSEGDRWLASGFLAFSPFSLPLVTAYFLVFLIGDIIQAGTQFVYSLGIF